MRWNDTTPVANLAAVLLFLLAPAFAAGQIFEVSPPPAGKIYHGVYPGGVTGEEDDITPADVDAYEALAGKRAAWVYFSHNWYKSRQFPLATASWIRDRGAVPYIRMMLRPRAFASRPAPPFKLSHILRGDIDQDLRRWAGDARDFGSPLLVEFGTECNGDWFPWNGRWNGGGATRRFGDANVADGPERFVAVFRLIHDIAREEGAHNITWVFHVNWDDWPEDGWNRFEEYYPGDDYVDWIAVSAYGPQTPMVEYLELFRDSIDSAYGRIQALAPGKPVIVAEFGVSAGNPQISPEDWAGPALDDLLALRWPNIIGLSWWNERWQNDNNPENDTTMRIQDIPALAQTFAVKLEAAAAVLQLDPLYSPASIPPPAPAALEACPPAPLAQCQAPARSNLFMRTGSDGRGDRLSFNFIEGVTAQVWDDLRDPTAETAYLACLYVGDNVAAAASVPPGAAAWRSRPRGRGYKYSDREGSAAGIVRFKLKAGARGTPQAPDLRLRAKGVNLPDLPLPVPEPIDVAVQLLNARNHNCWGDSYTSASANKDGQTRIFRASKP